MSVPPTVLYDANVLYPSFLRDFLIRLARTGAVRARWTEAIHQEWIRSLLRNRPDLPPDRLLALKDLINTAVPDCLVENFARRIDTLSLPDPDDRHVLAAALEAGAEVIVTFDLADFPPTTLQPLGISARTPADFVAETYDRVPERVAFAAREHRSALRNPEYSAQEYLDRLRRNGLGPLADRIEADAIGL